MFRPSFRLYALRHLHRAPALVLAALSSAAALTGQHPAFAQQSEHQDQPMYVAPASDEGGKQIATFKLAPGLQCSLAAAEPDLCNVVSFAFDDQGRCYVAETFRINDGVFDTRNYMQWKDDDLACLTVADRLAKYEKHIAKDLPKYAAYSERVRLLVDTNRDFVFDRSTVFADGFADLADGIGAGVLPVGGDVFFTNIPKLWRLRDTDGDGRADRREAVFDGFGVHTSLIGHDLHGLCLGPDRRLYFSIGDRGFDVTTKEGVHLAHPHEGAVLRCELDGSNLEVVHRGLRNPQELAFDDQGNLFTGDNNSDGGDRARFVHIVEGGDSGWRIGFQWLDDRGAWNRERLWWPPFPGQPQWHVPPVINVADGPSGLAFDPGTGFPERFRGCFFLCDFRGGPSYSGVHALQFAPKGAGFELVRRERPIWGVLCTDVDFGPDGAMYVLDWVDGWNKTGKGRLYRVEPPGLRNDLQARAVAQLIASDFAGRTDAQLQALLAHPDRRVRQKAEFALCDRKAVGVLLAAAKDIDHRLARLHGIWGLGVLGRKDGSALADVPALLADGDAAVRGQAARVLGDAHVQEARSALLPLLEDQNSRVRFEAAQALGKLKVGETATVARALLAMLRDNDDRDPWLRHAGVMGLVGVGDRDALLAASGDKSRAARLGVLLALRRLGDREVVRFLADDALATEAARAIYDGGIDSALPDLAAQMAQPHDEAFVWRALNAARLVGTPDMARKIATFAADRAHKAAMRIEALRILAEWPQPHGQDRVLGNWRPCTHADIEAVAAELATSLPPLLADDAVAAEVAAACGRLKLRPAAEPLAKVADDRGRKAAVRTAALRALDALDDPALDTVVAAITAQDPLPLRKAAVKVLARRDPKKAVPVLATMCREAELGERQAAFAALGDLRDPAAAALLGESLDALEKGTLEPAVQLDVLEAAKKRQEESVQQKLQAIAAAAPKDKLAEWRVCLEGGDVEAGRRVFFDNEQTRCTRCHTAEGRGGNAGPVLDGIGTRQQRDYLLESLIDPSAKIAQGFATTLLELHNGDLVAGVLVREQDGVVELVDVQGETHKVPVDRIKSRSASPTSAMPPMGGPLDKRQVRDVVAFLASLKAAPPAK
jgi:quinoprotein glucose dehydrogenase